MLRRPAKRGLFLLLPLLGALTTLPAVASPSRISPRSSRIVATAGSCDGGEVNDDGTPEGSRGYTTAITTATVVQDFQPPAYPAVYLEVCVAWSRNGGDSSIAYDIVFYDDDGGGGEPGTLLAAVPTRADGVPFSPDFAFYSTVVALPAIASGSVYIGVRWDPSVEQSFFYFRDESLTTPQRSTRTSTDDGASWFGAIGVRAFLIRARSTADYVVVPNGREFSPSNVFDEDLPFTTPYSRCQQVYLGSEVGPGRITEVRFRPAWGELGDAFLPHLFGNARVALSTTTRAVDALSTTFSANVGLDEVVVFQGDLLISSEGVPQPGPKMFDIVVPLQVPFDFRATGNLLLDISLPQNSLPSTIALDAHDGVDSVSRACCGDLPSCPDGSVPAAADSTGLVTMFRLAASEIFADGFESGNTSAWSNVVP